MFEIIYMTLIGTIIGSFLNVCIYRIPSKQSVITPRSHCMGCGHTLGVWELIPILSYVGLRGKCKSCHCSISPRYMGVEVLTGVLFGVIVYKFGINLEGIMYLCLTCFLIVLSMIDLDYMILPTNIIRVGIGVGLIFKMLQVILNHSMTVIIDSLLAGGIGYGILWCVFYGAKWLFKKEGMGFGDVRLVGMLGIYIGMKYLFLMIIGASILAALVGVILLCIRKKSEAYPMGPFFSGAALIVILWGEPLMTWYFKLYY